MLRVFIICWGCILMGCGSSKVDSDDSVSVKFHDTTLELPRKYLLPNLPASISDDGGSLDDGEGVSLKIPLSEINYNVVSNKGLIGNAVVFLTPLPPRVSEASVSDDVLNAWQGRGLYSDRVVEYDSVVNLYRVYSKAGYPKLWNYFRVEPEANSLDQKNWVANCMVGPLEKESDDLSNVKCNTIMSYKDVQVELSYSAIHLPSLEKLLSNLKVQLVNWDTSQQ